MINNVEWWLAQRHLGDKLQRLANLAPWDVKAIELITDDALRARWPTYTQFLRLFPPTRRDS